MLVLSLTVTALGWVEPVAATDGPRHVRVGVYQNRPKIFHDASGTAKGFFPEIIQELAAAFDWRVDFVPCDWAACLDMVEAGQLDIMPDVAFSRQRRQRFQFSHEAVLQSWSNIYSRKGHGLAALNGLAGHDVAVLRDSIQHKRLATLSREEDWGIHIHETETMMDALDLVLRGVADYGVVNKFFGEAVEQRTGLERSIILFNATPLYLVFPKSFDRNLVRAIDAHVASLKADRESAYYRAIDAWLKPPPRFAIPRWVYWTLAAAGLLIVSGFAVTAYLRNRIAEATSALRESEHRFRDYALASADHFWEMDANLRFSQFYDSTPGEAKPPPEANIGKNRWEVAGADADGDPVWRAHRDDLMARRPFREFEYQCAAEDGAPEWWRVNGVPVFADDGHFVGYRGTATEISRQKLLEEKLHRAERLQAIGQLTGGVAHDFNNILSILVGNAEFLEDIVRDDKEGRRIIETIKQAVARGSSLTNTLLAFSRKQSLSPASVDVASLVADLGDMLRRTLGEAIDVMIAAAPELWPALVDPRQFENALINLAINARDAMPKGGTLTIASANVTLDHPVPGLLDDVGPGDYVRVAVTDTGTGMPREVIENAVEPFFTTKEIGEGSGLGLSMVYGFVKQSGGHLTIESDAGCGTVVTLYLPRSATAAVREGDDGAGSDFARGTGRVLIVEDDPDVRAIPATILRNQGYRVVEAGDAVEAIACVRNGDPFDILFTDVVLPGGMNGAEVAEDARRTQPGIKVLYATGYAPDAAFPDKAVEPDALLINKPYTRTDLLQKVQALLKPASG